MQDNNVEFLFKRLTDFHLLRIIRAQKHVYEAPITAYLSDVFFSAGLAYGVSFEHIRRDLEGQFSDGHLMRTSTIRFVRKEGRFWVLTTMNSRYVIASFKKCHGRPSFQNFLRSTASEPGCPPHITH
ncbi:hypothetical protein PS928_04829 [Pseudomonas fluorescens]|uniref:Uncharacterized protein n=1 Tax=Pseudomonas fluorescens TaxID=294 RepID=A0A5E7V644_PSEFL|nr:hypothetical protein PS928_04829 [Pseudomonas fluorescens]